MQVFLCGHSENAYLVVRNLTEHAHPKGYPFSCGPDNSCAMACFPSLEGLCRISQTVNVIIDRIKHILVLVGSPDHLHLLLIHIHIIAV